MSQHDFNIANQTFPSFRADLNDALVAAATMSAGSSAPTTPYAYQLWFDTTTGTWKVRNSGNTAWVSTITTDLATGNVLIGDSAPQITSKLTVSGNGSADTGTFMYDGSAGTYFDINTNAANGTVDLEANARTGAFPPLTFKTGGTEVGRWDASGNLLAGTTNTDPAFNNVTGQSMASTGQLQVTRDGGTAALFNRKTSDGEIVSFRKDSGTVGSIRSIAGPQIAIGGTTDGLAFYTGGNQIYPCNMSTGGNRDATIDLGYASSRFKDLYLSGGVYLGGTASANQLHFYEEGTWNITLNGGLTPTITTAHYTVIGNRVFLNCSIHIPTNSSSDIMAVGGLPFATNGDGSGSLSYTTATTSNSLGILVQSSTIYFYKGGTSYTLAEFSNHALRFTAQYRINN